MSPDFPRAYGEPPAGARIRASRGDFVVTERLGFELSGDGEHACLYLEKTGLNTAELVQRLSRLAAVAPVDIGFSGLKDRDAVTRQWLSVRLPGRAEPDWSPLEAQGDVRVLAVGRHRRKLKRGVHRANEFVLRLRDLHGGRDELEQRLRKVRARGVPNYFGEQRFGRNGETLLQARAWAERGGPSVSRTRRGFYFSALRAALFNAMLAERVGAGDWDRLAEDDACMLQGTRSVFTSSGTDAAVAARIATGDVHPALPLWGEGRSLAGPAARRRVEVIAAADPAADFLVRRGLALAHRATRVFADDFCWKFCDDGSLQLELSLPAGSYATTVLKELVQYRDKSIRGETGE